MQPLRTLGVCMKILFISLGCDKNLVDSEEMLGLLTKSGNKIVDTEEEAEGIIINTCCFIHDAKWRRSWKWQNIKKQVPVRLLLSPAVWHSAIKKKS